MGNLKNLFFRLRKVCGHKKYDVDENTIKQFAEKSLSGSVLRLFMGPQLDGIQYDHYLGATANCRKCDQKLKVRTSYKTVGQKEVLERYDWEKMEGYYSHSHIYLD